MEIYDIFNQGISFDEFVNKDTDTYKEKTLQILKDMKLHDNLIDKVRKIDNEINVLVCAELWCPDCMINVPVIEKMRQINENIKISIVGKEGNEEVFKKYAPEENIKIPTFVFYDKNFNEMGSLVEHPSKMKDILSNGSQSNRIVAMRKYRKGEYAEETLKDILNIIL